MANVRSSGWRHSQRKPSASSALNGRRSTGGAATAGPARFVTTMLKTSPAAAAKDPASKRIGSTKPVANRMLASGGPTNWLATISAAYIWPLACSRSRVVDDRRQERLGAVVVEHLAGAEQQRGDEDDEVEEPLGADDGVDLVGRRQRAAAGQHGQRHQRGQDEADGVGADHQPAAVVAVGDDAGGQGEQQPRQALDDPDEGDQQRVAGDRRRQPRVGDERRRRRRGWRSSSPRTACGSSTPGGASPPRRT